MKKLIFDLANKSKLYFFKLIQVTCSLAIMRPTKKYYKKLRRVTACLCQSHICRTLLTVYMSIDEHDSIVVSRKINYCAKKIIFLKQESTNK